MIEDLFSCFSNLLLPGYYPGDERRYEKSLQGLRYFFVEFSGIDHPFGHILSRGRYGICPYSLDQTMIKADFPDLISWLGHMNRPRNFYGPKT